MNMDREYADVQAILDKVKLQASVPARVFDNPWNALIPIQEILDRGVVRDEK